VGEEAEGGRFVSGRAWPALRYTESVYIEKYLQRTDICSSIVQTMILHERNWVVTFAWAEATLGMPAPPIATKKVA
jgi:hypothetical protein